MKNQRRRRRSTKFSFKKTPKWLGIMLAGISVLTLFLIVFLLFPFLAGEPILGTGDESGKPDSFYKDDAPKVSGIARQIVWEGDSRVMQQNNISNPPYYLSVLLGANFYIHSTTLNFNAGNLASVRNIAAPGQTYQNIIASQTKQIDVHYNSAIENLLILDAGGNDLIAAGNNVQQVFEKVLTLYSNYTKRGWVVYVCTIETAKVSKVILEKTSQYNKLLRKNLPSNRIIDFAADSRFQNPADTNIYSDGVHHTDEGHKIRAQIVRDFIAANSD